ncbi:bifunctional 4-hydroxy-2-oxoglutarate aldolase/2-dehydro-3-deoxy-phosphogluconate aldolase [Actinoplanes sp. M2I2]|uniref:bifunctional 4-hydroxy-2-oxoglutarate aldolase/2-dehydro-3-deoxy-phosphogluconate aldolase n=1 Tax=Actinoplanes sp. M2I2 TaxID=1734444 RepID=UPI0020223E10|nr:bifunctional 4-hydroxy-2-oxoglutarate aldolase/2-dehydro-3-deoxy-phosphogluconate aldolase [Actinoplanes sp. M2I2]
MYRWETVAALTAQHIIGIVRGTEVTAARQTAQAFLDAGLHTLEVTLTTPGALDIIGDLASTAPAHTVIGAGTVLDAAAAGAAVRAGARFLVTPNVRSDVIRAGHRHGVPVIPGAGTVTEVMEALELGADAVKIFPAASLGPDWVRAVLAAVPYAPLVPTGGVSPSSAPEWIEAGAVACGVGAALTEGGPEQAAARVAAMLRAVGRSDHPIGHRASIPPDVR